MIPVEMGIVDRVDDITRFLVVVVLCDGITDGLVLVVMIDGVARTGLNVIVSMLLVLMSSSYSIATLGHTGRFAHTNDSNPNTINRARITVTALTMVNKYPIA